MESGPRTSPEQGRPGPPKGARPLLTHPLVLACLAAGLLLSVWASTFVEDVEMSAFRAEFAHSVEGRFATLQREMGAHLEFISSVANLYCASLEVEREEFRLFTEARLEHHPFIRAVMWVPRVRRSDREAFEGRVRAEGFPDFHVREMPVEAPFVAPNPGGDHYPVAFLVPHRENAGAFGKDLSTDPTFLDLLRRAARTEKAVVSPPVAYFGGSDDATVVLAFRPVYSDANGRSALTGTPDRIAGFVVGVFNTEEALLDAFEGLPSLSARVRLFDVSGGSPGRLLAESPGTGPWDDSPEIASLEVKQQLLLGHRVWQTVWRPGAEALAAHTPWEYHLVLLGGSLLTVLASFLVSGLIRTRRGVRLVRAQAAELGRANERLAAEVAERRRVEGDLRRSEAGYRGLVDNALFGIYRSTPAGRFLEGNPAFLRMLGCASLEELKRLDLTKDVYLDPMKRGELLEEFESGTETTTCEVRWRRRDGTSFTARLCVRAVRDDDGEIDCFVVIAEDVTDRIELEEQLRQAQRVEAIGRLAGGIAHDFNNLLTVILGQTQRLLASTTEPSDLHTRLVEIRQCGERARDLTSQLLAFGRRQMLRPVILDLSEVVREAEQLLRRLIWENVEFVIRTADAPATTRVDAVQIQQVIVNLVINARDALPREGGTITIETALAEIGEGTPRAQVVAPGRYVLLAVTDTGCGMEQETREHIFEPFFSTKDQGTGLGLATVHGIVRQSGGHLNVESEAGKGSRFEVYLPRVSRPAGEPESEGDAAPAPGGCETLLLVEDEPAVLELAAETLEVAGYRVLSAGDGAEALALAQAHDGEIELLITDLVMPGMDGLELSTRLQKLWPWVPTLFMSGYTSDVITKHGTFEPGTAFIQKPFTLDDLATKVREVLNSGVRPDNCPSHETIRLRQGQCSAFEVRVTRESPRARLARQGATTSLPRPVVEEE